MKVLFEKSQIENRIKEIGVQILNRHKEENNPIVLVGVLNGGFMFYSKLVDQLALLDPQCDFIRVKSYKGREHEVVVHTPLCKLLIGHDNTLLVVLGIAHLHSKQCRILFLFLNTAFTFLKKSIVDA